MTIKSIIAVFILLFSFIADAKPYKRVVVFSGGGFEFAQFLGVMDALEESNMKPDLIIATCGGSLAATIIANLPTMHQRQEFLYSPRFRRMIRSITPVGNISNILSGMQWLGRRKSEADNRRIPDIFNDYLLNVPTSLPIPEFDIPFSDSSIPVIIVAGKVLFTSNMAGQSINNQKLYREMIFTSPAIANQLQEIKLRAGSAMPGSSIEWIPEVSTAYTVLEADRAAITNPFVLPPAPIKGEYFVGGTVNLYPLELARDLGDEVIMSFGGSFADKGDVPVVRAAYQFNPNVRLTDIDDQYADWWVDASDRDDLNNKNGFGIVTRMKVSYFRIPMDDQVFDNDILEQYKYGKSRMIEALKQPTRNHKCHVRIMTQDNSSFELRHSCGRAN